MLRPGLGRALLALGLRVRTPDEQRAGDHQHNPDRGAAGSGRLLQGGAQWAPCRTGKSENKNQAKIYPKCKLSRTVLIKPGTASRLQVILKMGVEKHSTFFPSP